MKGEPPGGGAMETEWGVFPPKRSRFCGRKNVLIIQAQRS